MGKRTRLSDAEVTASLLALPGWAREGDTLRRTFTFSGFPEAVAFVQALVAPAEAMDHHPDVDLRYNKVTVALSTHSAGGITALDVELAGAISNIR
jgi:4a-hydroxytetrahydrobiopterin dehydratase